MATYNGSSFLRQQVESVLSQLNLHDELIIADDHSTDDTLFILKSYRDDRIKILPLPESPFRNPIFNFEYAIENAQNEFIYLCDQDDIWLPNKVDTFQNTFLSTNCDMILSDCTIVDENLSVRYESYRSVYQFRPGKLQSFLANPYLGCCMAFKKRVLAKLLPFPKYIPMHDIWIGIICEFFYNVAIIEEPLMLYRRHSKNATPFTASGKSQHSSLKKLTFRLNMARGLLLAYLR
ncbi:glycosyltransferase family 2 protein [Arundinibacter roseus]|nr:glycosyltransferase family 2 protein [Arundinibacter roseus]